MPSQTTTPTFKSFADMAKHIRAENRRIHQQDIAAAKALRERRTTR